MLIYLATWMLITSYCASPPPLRDAYGRTSDIVLASCVTRRDTTRFQRYFRTQAEADTFLAHAPTRDEATRLQCLYKEYTSDWAVDTVRVDSQRAEAYLEAFTHRVGHLWHAPINEDD